MSKFSSLKMGKTIWCESQLERDFCYLLEFDSGVIEYSEQPLHVRYYLNSRWSRYTPDFFVLRSQKKQIVEIKPEAKALEEENIALFRCISNVLYEEGYEFVVVTDRIVRTQPRLSNIKLFWRYARVSLHPQHQIYCQEMLASHESAPLSEVLSFFESKGETKAVVYALLYWGLLATDLMRPVNSNSVIYLPMPKADVGSKES